MDADPAKKTSWSIWGFKKSQMKRCAYAYGIQLHCDRPQFGLKKRALYANRFLLAQDASVYTLHSDNYVKGKVEAVMTLALRSRCRWIFDDFLLYERCFEFNCIRFARSAERHEHRQEGKSVNGSHWTGPQVMRGMRDAIPLNQHSRRDVCPKFKKSHQTKSRKPKFRRNEFPQNTKKKKL